MGRSAAAMCVVQLWRDAGAALCAFAAALERPGDLARSLWCCGVLAFHVSGAAVTVRARDDRCGVRCRGGGGGGGRVGVRCGFV